jgi:ParB family chromosome partitioning protein
MKTNAPKRKMFQDAVDLVSPPEKINSLNGSQTMISVENIVPFHNHPFRLYEGKRLDDMVESIREHGILIPVIVQKVADGYEMLSGHNRWNAAKIAGITEVPAIIKENLTEREAYVYVIETNMLQRSFDDLLPSEKAAVLAERYEKVMCQGRRNDILEEIALLNGVDAPETCGHDVHKSKSRDSIGEDYGMTGRNIARYMRLNQTTDQIKEMVDEGTMAMVTAVELSYLSEEEQKQVCTVLNEHGGKIKNAQATELHKEAGSLTADKVKSILVGEVKEKPVSDAKLFAQIKKKYFKGKSTDEIMGVLEQALTTWFAKAGDMSV